MPELPVVRETPEQISFEIRNRGGVTIPEEARKAHRLLVDIEILSVTRTQYLNLQYNLPQGDYCNVTYWAGASISQTRKVKYVSERLIDWVNIEAGMAYHASLIGQTIIQTIVNLATALGYGSVELPRRPPNVWGYPISHLKFVAPPDTQFRVTIQWYPFVDVEGVSEPDPDLDDPASGEDEYPSPRNNPRNDPWRDNNEASPLDPERDERDYDSANIPPVPGSITGKGYRVAVSYIQIPPNNIETPVSYVVYACGPVSYSTSAMASYPGREELTIFAPSVVPNAPTNCPVDAVAQPIPSDNFIKAGTLSVVITEV